MAERPHASNIDLSATFQSLAAYSHAVIAVSGGSDSMALMHLVRRWMLTSAPAVRVSVATVDHGLRAESTVEAQCVADAARGLGFEAEILTWQGEKPSQGVQEQARHARYRLLGEHARALGPGQCAIVTAHTREDQAETLLMRLARGSGPDGLQGMRPVRSLEGVDGVDLVRPLLDVSRAVLKDVLIVADMRWIDDPSNEDLRFARVRLRSAADVLAGLNLTPPMLALAAKRQRRAADALDWAADAAQASILAVNGGLFASLAAPAFEALPEEIRVRLLGRVLRMFGGASPAPDLAQIEVLAQSLENGQPLRTTLGGCEVRACRKEIRVFRERGRANLDAVEVHPGEAAIWDARFVITVTGGEEPVVVRALDALSTDRLRRHARSRLLLPARAAATLPAVWAGGELVSVGGVPAHYLPDRRADMPAKVETRFVFASCGDGP